jgi:hypothetical protein
MNGIKDKMDYVIDTRYYTKIVTNIPEIFNIQRIYAIK